MQTRQCSYRDPNRSVVAVLDEVDWPLRPSFHNSARPDGSLQRKDTANFFPHPNPTLYEKQKRDSARAKSRCEEFNPITISNGHRDHHRDRRPGHHHRRRLHRRNHGADRGRDHRLHLRREDDLRAAGLC